MTIPREHIANLDREGNVASLGASNLNDKLRDFDEKFVDKLRSLSIGRKLNTRSQLLLSSLLSGHALAYFKYL